MVKNNEHLDRENSARNQSSRLYVYAHNILGHLRISHTMLSRMLVDSQSVSV